MKNAHRKERKIRRIPPSSEPSSEVALDEHTPDSNAGDQDQPTARLSMPVTADGRIDVSRLREKSKSALRQALSDPALSVALGIDAASSTSNEDAAILAQVTDTLFVGVSALSVAIAMKSGFRPEHAKHLVWTADEKAMAAPLASKIANKRLMPMLSEEWRDEIMLGYIVLSIVSGKIMLMREAAKQPVHVQPSTETA